MPCRPLGLGSMLAAPNPHESANSFIILHSLFSLCSSESRKEQCIFCSSNRYCALLLNGTIRILSNFEFAASQTLSLRLPPPTRSSSYNVVSDRSPRPLEIET
jgi:hypothetical protein